MAAKIRRDDEVIVLTGKDKGKRGKVKNVLSSGKVIVEGINRLIPSTMTLPEDRTFFTLPRLPLSLPVNTITSSSRRIFAAMIRSLEYFWSLGR